MYVIMFVVFGLGYIFAWYKVGFKIVSEIKKLVRGEKSKPTILSGPGAKTAAPSGFAPKK
jgi:hypothetical protein